MDHATRDGERCVYGFLWGSGSAVGACGGEVRLRSMTIRGVGDAENGGNRRRGGSSLSGKVG